MECMKVAQDSDCRKEKEAKDEKDITYEASKNR